MSAEPTPEQAKPTLKGFYPHQIMQFVNEGGDPNLIIKKAETEKEEDIVLLDKAWHGGDPRDAVELVKFLIDKGADPNPLTRAKHPDLKEKLGEDRDMRFEDTLLLRTLMSGSAYTEIARVLLQGGADPNIQNKWGNAPLTYAVSQDHDLIDLLIEKGADVSAQDGEGKTPLIQALARTVFVKKYSRIEKYDVVKKLLEKGADPNIRDKDGDVPLIYAIMNNLKIIDLLLEKGADVNAKDGKGNTPLIAAVNYKKYDLIQKLLEKGADVNIKIGDHTILDILFDDTDTKDYNKFFIDILKRILQKFEGEITHINEIFFIAAKTDDLDMAKILSDKGIDLRGRIPDADRQTTFLMSALFNKSTKIINYLLDFVKNIDETNDLGQTALNYAIVTGNVNAVDILLKKGASLNMKDPSNDTFWVPRSIAQAIRNNINAFSIGNLVRTIVTELKNRGDTALIEALANYRHPNGFYFYQYLPNEEVELRKMLSDFIPKWEGVYEEDAAQWAEVTSQKSDISMCPFCLAYLERDKGCKYMNHKCDVNIRHPRLYNVYKNDEGKVYWCTICGRHCTGHRHHIKSDGKETTKVGFAGEEGNVFSPDCSIGEGGGGPFEKIARIQAMIDKAEELESQIGVIPEYRARQLLVEAAWNPISKVKVPKGKFKPAPPPPAFIPDVPRKPEDATLLPVKVTDSKDCVAYLGEHEDGRPVFRFKHRLPDGTVYTHPPEENICYDDMMNALRSTFLETKGKCPYCAAIVHPLEVKSMLDQLGTAATKKQKDAYQNYRDSFNSAYKVGGGRGSRFRMTDEDKINTELQCELPFKKKGGRNKSFKKRLIKRRKTYRKNLKRTRKNK
jgi:ankyrin repeat protein